jgi:Mlc titration factor MtfA (ptsG expression regulator)
MNNPLFLKFLLLLAAVPIVIYLSKIPRKRKRRRLYKAPFPTEWIKILKTGFALYNYLPEALKRQLHGHIHIFLDEKNFVGYKGIIITDTIRVVIAAQACVLLLNRKTNYYPHLGNILVYPNAFKESEEIHSQHGSRLGESWHRGPIVLSWQHSQLGASDAQDGENVVMHEFAHQLDQENSASDGLPLLQHNNVKQWSQVLSKEFNALKLKRKLREKSLLNKYGATNAAEFFAVITEHFIEQPSQLNTKHPQLYQELKKYYQIDPLNWNN